MHMTDEMIAAFLDGALPEDEAAVFEAEMARDLELSERVARWRRHDTLLRAGLDPIVERPVSDELLERLGLSNPVITEPQPLPANDNVSVVGWRWPALAAIAASAALALWFAVPRQAVDLADSAAFQTALESRASGDALAMNDGRAIAPTLTFAAADGRFCREFAVRGRNEQSGVACRSNSKWQIEALVKGAPASANASEIATADGADATKLDAVYDRLNASDPLSAENEKVILSKRWTK